MVAGGAATAIGTETLEERTGEIDLPSRAEGFQDSMGVRKRKEIWQKSWSAVLGRHDCDSTQQECTQDPHTNFQHEQPPLSVTSTECSLSVTSTECEIVKNVSSGCKPEVKTYRQARSLDTAHHCGEPAVLILCSTPPHSSSFQPTPAKVRVSRKPWLE